MVGSFPKDFGWVHFNPNLKSSSNWCHLISWSLHCEMARFRACQARFRWQTFHAPCQTNTAQVQKSGTKYQKSGTGTNFIRAVPKIERSENGTLISLSHECQNPPFLGYCLPSWKILDNSNNVKSDLKVVTVNLPLYITSNYNTKKLRFLLRRPSNVEEAVPPKWQKNWLWERLIVPGFELTDSE
jgi:hypothetical protein